MLNALSALLLALFGYFFFKSLMGDKTDYRARMEEARRKAAEHKEKARAAKQSREKVTAEDMRQCTVCNAYIPASSAINCGREGCPY